MHSTADNDSSVLEWAASRLLCVYVCVYMYTHPVHIYSTADNDNHVLLQATSRMLFTCVCEYMHPIRVHSIADNTCVCVYTVYTHKRFICIHTHTLHSIADNTNCVSIWATSRLLYACVCVYI